jgi:hypothetical protein
VFKWRDFRGLQQPADLGGEFGAEPVLHRPCIQLYKVSGGRKIGKL